MLNGKKILIGVCGSIAAYKSAFLVRLLVKEGAEVQVIQTPSSIDFITPLTLSTLSKRPVYSGFTKSQHGEWVNHVDLGLWADLMVIAPLSASTLAKLATGLSDNLLTATYLSARCPVMLAPAMDLDMYQHPTTIANMTIVRNHGCHVVDAEDGELASGLSGVGRMAEPEHILESIRRYFDSKKPLVGKRVLITSGPTHEPLDPVRFIGNHSTGKMGVALAEAAQQMGAEVTLISGPSSHLPKKPGIKLTQVQTADEMYEACSQVFDSADIAIFAAAVADYKPATKAAQKIKKDGDVLEIQFIKNKDIALEMGKKKRAGQITVGFALETENEAVNATAKLHRKNFDLLVLNSLNDEGAGFAHNTNKISIFSKSNIRRDFELKSKAEVAQDILDSIIELI